MDFNTINHKNNNFLQKLIQILHLEIQHKKNKQDRTNRKNENKKNGQPSHATAQE